jgi:hypothetical protein
VNAHEPLADKASLICDDYERGSVSLVVPTFWDYEVAKGDGIYLKGDGTVKKQLLAVTSLATLMLASSVTSWAQTSEEFKTLREDIGTLKELQELRRDIEGLKAGQQGLQKDLQEIKTLLQNRPAAAAAAPAVPQNLVLDLDGAPMKGEKTAKLALVEYTDYQ